MKQDYALKKYVRAESAGEAILLDTDAKVDEVFLGKRPDLTTTDAVGFHTVEPDTE
jgi:hypothetical protein